MDDPHFRTRDPENMTLRRALAIASLSLCLPSLASGQPFPTLSPTAEPGTGEVVDCDVRGAAVRCGTYRVWEDRAAKTGRTIDLAFVVVPASAGGAAPEDAIVFLPGGPGQALTGSSVDKHQRAIAVMRASLNIPKLMSQMTRPRTQRPPPIVSIQ